MAGQSTDILDEEDAKDGREGTKRLFPWASAFVLHILTVASLLHEKQSPRLVRPLQLVFLYIQLNQIPVLYIYIFQLEKYVS